MVFGFPGETPRIQKKNTLLSPTDSRIGLLWFGLPELLLNRTYHTAVQAGWVAHLGDIAEKMLHLTTDCPEHQAVMKSQGR